MGERTSRMLGLGLGLLGAGLMGGSPGTAAVSDWILTTEPEPSVSPLPLPSGQEDILPLASAADRIAAVASTLIVGEIEVQQVTAWDVNRRTRLWQVAVGFAPTVVLIDEGRQRVYVSGLRAPGMVILDLRSGQQVGSAPLVSGALDLTLDPVTGQVFAALPASQSIAVFNPLSGEVRGYAVPGSPLAVVYDAPRGHLIASLGEVDTLGIVVLDPANGELLARWRSGRVPEALALDSRRQQLLVLNSGSQELLVIDLASNGQRVQRIGLEWRPTRLTVQGDFAYISSRDHNRIQVVNLQTLGLEQTWTTATEPTGLVPVELGKTLAVVVAGIPAVQFLSLAVPSPAVTRVSTGAISGRVVDVINQPVSEGQVRWNNQQVPISPEGTYILPEVPAGLQVLDIRVPGFPANSIQVQVRAGFVSTPTVRLPPRLNRDPVSGVGLLPDGLPFSDELARQLTLTLTEQQPQRRIMLLRGPVGIDPEFVPLQDLLKSLTVVDRNQRYTTDLQKLQVIGSALKLRYILLTQVQTSQDYNRQGNSLLNFAFQFLAPGFPLQIPNFTPNILRSRGVIVLVDLAKHRPGDAAVFYELSGQDDVGGDPLYEEAAAGLFRQQVRNMIPQLVQQWQTKNPLQG